eukprot:gnl/Spiro4/22316_TR10988_c0_g1_i1.p1 gnl/Spiro4/22316_TR10988_c0_g1~~gnl/Spiro4/22316_TR10988_c0_g1_i1.p1  ORF type:complete len:416 (+),score=81.79 gnl/Spiro4/22316_TR10988_c0_g1_i1:73-1320(+)
MASRRRGGVNNSRFYELLGVPKDVSESDLRKAYRQMAMRYHPDKCSEEGAAQKFQEIQAAYDVLSDPDKRSTYDRYGEDGLKEGAGGPSDAESMFANIFGGGFGPFGFHGGGGPRQHRQPRGADFKAKIKVSLEDLYNGKSHRLQLERNVLCPSCKGKGGENPRRCTACGGRGQVLAVKRVGIMQVQQQIDCPECHASGEVMSKRCSNCRAEGVVSESKALEVKIEPGMQDEQSIRFEGEADHRPGILPGDVVIILKTTPHEKFKRTGNDLHMEHPLTLVEALCGTQFIITHLDGRKLLIDIPAGSVVKPGQIRSVVGEGFPTWKRPYEKGSLMIKFDVQFPDTIPPAFIQNLERVLPARPVVTYNQEEVYHCNLQNADLTSTAQSHRGEAYDDNDDDERGHHHPGVHAVPCQQS